MQEKPSSLKINLGSRTETHTGTEGRSYREAQAPAVKPAMSAAKPGASAEEKRRHVRSAGVAWAPPGKAAVRGGSGADP
ncbi:hypothetical protein, partial [Paenibacillus macerans]|uniref:hypothetical protein n=1 Tax=Paenibacillus macerans TaxID=44252 RepID=UPI003D31D56D